MPPQRPDLTLPTHIPHVEFDVLIRHRLDVEPDCWDGRYVLVELKLIQDRCQHQSHQPNYSKYRQWRHEVEARGPRGEREIVLVLPAASNPSISKRISFDPKILPIILDIWPPIFVEGVWKTARRCDGGEGGERGLRSCLREYEVAPAKVGCNRC